MVDLTPRVQGLELVGRLAEYLEKQSLSLTAKRKVANTDSDYADIEAVLELRLQKFLYLTNARTNNRRERLAIGICARVLTDLAKVGWTISLVDRDQLKKKTKSELVRLADGCRVDCSGSGANGAVLKADLIDALLNTGPEQEDSPRIIGERPPPDNKRSARRWQLLAARSQVLRSPTQHAFVKKMEGGKIRHGRAISIHDLMRDGRDLADRIKASRDADFPISPYVQLVEQNEECEHTGIPLSDIWRYFRLTWTNPPQSIPARQMRFLVRDGASPNHPVMGIGELSGAAVKGSARDAYLGWDIAAFKKWGSELSPDELVTWVKKVIHTSLEEIYAEDFSFLTGVLEADSSPEHIDHLKRIKAEARKKHESLPVFETLEDAKKAAAVPSLKGPRSWKAVKVFEEEPHTLHEEQDLESALKADGWVPEELEESKESKESKELGEISYTIQPIKPDFTKFTDSDWRKEAENPLFKSKRAGRLAELYDLWNKFAPLRAGADLEQFVEEHGGLKTFSRLILQAKGRTQGTAIADLTVCGALPPYNELLAGKLVAVLAASPELQAAYRARYQNRASVIASSMAGTAVKRDAELVAISTTGLYGKRPSQYDRISVPVDDLSDHGEGDHLKYVYLPESTKGYGTFQFSASTTRQMEEWLKMQTQKRRVSYQYGEGASPKMRLLREGLSSFGWPADELLVHGLEKSVYVCTLAKNYGRYLIGLDQAPEYLIQSENPIEMTNKIGSWWKERWVRKRATREDVLERIRSHTLVHPITHGARVKIPEDDAEQIPLFG